jgi:hypothetical protein
MVAEEGLDEHVSSIREAATEYSIATSRCLIDKRASLREEERLTAGLISSPLLDVANPTARRFERGELGAMRVWWRLVEALEPPGCDAR